MPFVVARIILNREVLATRMTTFSRRKGMWRSHHQSSSRNNNKSNNHSLYNSNNSNNNKKSSLLPESPFPNYPPAANATIVPRTLYPP